MSIVRSPETLVYISELDDMQEQLGPDDAWKQLIAKTNTEVYARRRAIGRHIPGLEPEAPCVGSFANEPAAVF